MEIHLPEFDDAMVWVGAFAVILSIFFFVREEILKRRAKKARKHLEQSASDIEEYTRKKE